MSKRKPIEFDVVPQKKKNVKPEMYRWYGVGDDDVIQIFDGSGPPTKQYTREVYGPGNTEDVNICYIQNEECEFVEEMNIELFVDKFDWSIDDVEAGMLYRGPVPDPDAVELEQFYGGVPEERELLDCEED